MKSASPALVALLNAAITEGATSQLYSVDLYTITTTSPVEGDYTSDFSLDFPDAASVVRLCTGDFDAIDNAGNVYSCGSIGSGCPKIDLKQSKVQGQWTRGLDDDQWTVALLPTVQDPFTGAFTYPDVFGATPWLAACRFGMFSGAAITVARAYWASPPTPAQIIAQGISARTCIGSVVVYAGIIGEVDATQTLCFFNCSSYKYLLSMNIPRNLVQGSCRNLLYDARCGLNAASFAQTATAQAGSTPFNVIATAPAPGGSGTYTKGRMACLTGANLGIQRMITNWASGAFQPQYPWPFPVVAGDTFAVYPGCDKSMGSGGCGGFHGANANSFFAGMPFVPQPEIQIG